MDMLHICRNSGSPGNALNFSFHGNYSFSPYLRIGGLCGGSPNGLVHNLPM